MVACCATISAIRLLIVSRADHSAEQSATVESEVVAAAGRIDTEIIGEPSLVRPAPDPIEITLTIDRTKVSKTYLEEAGLDTASADHWHTIFSQAAGSGNFVEGHSLTLFRDPETGDLRGLRYNLDDHVAINQQTFGAGVFRVSQELIRYTFYPIAVSFRLRNDFWHEAGRHELPRPILETLNYAFQENNALNKLPRGSDIKLIYEEKVSRDGTQRFPIGIQAAMISYSGKTLTAFAFRDETGRPRLYDANGQALEPQSLRFPVNFTYITSGFSFHRYHPILHRYRAHEGVDLAAEYGTPVKAVADGTIEEAGWCGGLGRCVRIRHDGGVVSIYGHLARLHEGIEAGHMVRVGEMIGEVGSSGLSTGPHLHYGIEKDGQYVNPLDQHLGVHHQVSPRLRQLFDHFKDQYMAALDRLPLGGHYTATLAGIQTPGSVAVSEDSTSGSIIRTAGHVVGDKHLYASSDETAALPISARTSIMR